MEGARDPKSEMTMLERRKAMTGWREQKRQQPKEKIEEGMQEDERELSESEERPSRWD